MTDSANPQDHELKDGIPPQADDDQDAAAIAVDDGKGNRMVPLSALIGVKKALKETEKRVKELEPIVARSSEIEDRLGKAQPLIDALITNPKLRAEALRVVQGTNKTPEAVDQPDDDPEMAAIAEDLGLYMADGVTPDVKRAHRVVSRMDGRNKRAAEEIFRPIAGVVAGSQADRNVAAALQMTDNDGNPLATQESIREVAQQLPPHLLANPQVMELVVNSAIGIDRRKGRTPKAPDEPIYISTAGGRGRRSEPVLSAQEKSQLEKLGLTEKEYTDANKRWDAGNGRSIVLGK